MRRSDPCDVCGEPGRVRALVRAKLNRSVRGGPLPRFIIRRCLRHEHDLAARLPSHGRGRAWITDPDDPELL